MTRSSWLRYSQNSAMPPSCRNDSSTGSGPRRSVRVSSSPGTMNEVCRARVSSSSQVKVASRVKIWRSGQNRTRVPVTPFFTRPPLRRPDCGSNGAFGPSPAKTPGAPRWNDIAWVAGDRSTSTSRRADRALTTEDPTPCRPPVAAYDPPPNLPPACSLVKTTSTPESPVLGSLSTGMPRPSSCTSADPSGCSRTIDLAADARERLVHGVVDDLPQAVHQAAGVGRADVHARPLAHGLQPFEDEQVLGVVGVVDGSTSARSWQRFDGLHRAREAGVSESTDPASGADGDAPPERRGTARLVRCAELVERMFP